MAMDEDFPPTLSLRDNPDSSSSPPTHSMPSYSYTTAQLPTPPSLTPTPETTTLHVFGPPSDQLAQLGPWLGEIGPIKGYQPGPEGSNWWIVEYLTPTAASYALRKHGDIIGGRWMIGFKVATGNVRVGESMVPLSSAANGGGTALHVQSAPILKQKMAMIKKTGEEYAWDEAEAPSGFVNKAAEWLVSGPVPPIFVITDRQE